MIIGFTGTRYGMTGPQMRSLARLLNEFREGYLEAHHGDCVGGDMEFHQMCRQLQFDKIVAHPPADSSLRAHCEADEILKPKPYGERNKDIVEAVDYVIGAPNSKIFQPRGGTFQTIRLAQNEGNLWRIVFPDGSVVKG